MSEPHWDEPPPWDDPVPGSTPAPAQDDPPALHFGSVDEFVREYLIHAYKRRVDQQRILWAPNWWAYDEAIQRLEALWRAWEHLRLDPALGMSMWWRDHADHHMAILMSDTGPFAGIQGQRTALGSPLPYEAPPAGMFPTER